MKDNLLALGVSVKAVNKIASCYNRFLSYMQSHHKLHMEEQQSSEKWFMPHIRPGCKANYGIGRILFAGEIAGSFNHMKL